MCSARRLRKRTHLPRGRDHGPGFCTAALATLMLGAIVIERGVRMPHVIVIAEVKDVPHWLNSQKRAEVLGARGYSDIKTYVDQDGSNRVALAMNVEDLDAARADGQTQEVVDLMEYDGVVLETVVSFVES
jgi:hypothetical protein